MADKEKEVIVQEPEKPKEEAPAPAPAPVEPTPEPPAATTPDIMSVLAKMSEGMAALAESVKSLQTKPAEAPKPEEKPPVFPNPNIPETTPDKQTQTQVYQKPSTNIIETLNEMRNKPSVTYEELLNFSQQVIEENRGG